MKNIFISLFGIMLLGTTSVYAQFPEPAADEDAGFEQILTDQVFDNWEGDRDYWRLEGGVLIGEVPEDKPLEENTFLIWNEPVADFELKVDYRISSNGNSGINYRSKPVDGVEYGLRGYQADFDGANQWSGQVYEERGREFLALRGQITYVGEDDVANQIGSLGDGEELSEVVNDGGWNEYHLIVRGNNIIQMLNGQVMSIVIDDGAGQAKEGMLGVQMHTGPPMKVEFRDARYKEL